jgi:thymidylate kinase
MSPFQVAARRRAAAGRPLERYDADAVQARVARNYLELARQHANVQVLDGSGDLDTVAQTIARAVDVVLR